MRRRIFCLGLGALACGGLLSACGDSAVATPIFQPEATLARMASLDAKQLVRLIVAASPQGQVMAHGLFIYYGQRETDPTGATTLAYMLSPGYHRLAYHVCESDDTATRTYAARAAGIAEDDRSTPYAPVGLPYPATLLIRDDTGVGAVRVGKVVVSLIASGTNPRFVTALLLGGTAYLEHLLASAASADAHALIPPPPTVARGRTRPPARSARADTAPHPGRS